MYSVNKSNVVNIVLTADKNYTKVIAVTMVSILENLSPNSYARFFIFSYHFNNEDLEVLQSLQQIRPCEIINIPMEEHIHKFDFINVNTFKNQWISIACYFRLLLFEILPADVDKCFFVDGDMIVDCDLSQIILPQGKLFGATIEASAMKYRESVLKHCFSLLEFEKFQQSAIKYPYFNAGFFLVNLRLARKLNIYRNIMDLLHKYPALPFADQDLLNMVFGQKYSDLIEYLPPEYNIFADLDYDIHFDKIPFSDEVLKKALGAPKIYHYAGEKKPWLTMDVRNFYNKWWHYYRLSPFKKDYYIKQFRIWLKSNKGLKSIIQNIFSITNIISDGKKFKQITIMGIKIKVKKNSDVQIFVSYHKPFKLFKNKYLQPIHVGRDVFLNKDTCDGDYQKIKKWLLKNTIGDNTSDNISLKNPNYCELTAQYWAWKNCNANYVGFCHYRRLFDLNNSKISKLLNEYDIILPRIFTLDCTVREQYNRDHIKEDLDKTLEIIASKYPDYMEDAENVLNKKTIYFCNMFITNRELFNSYCEWLFDILFELEKVTVISENKYQSRIFGFLSERLLNIFIEHVKRIDDIKICEVPVKFIEENKFSFLQRLFSVTNEGYHKIIMLLGMKFKFKNKYKELKSEIANLRVQDLKQMEDLKMNIDCKVSQLDRFHIEYAKKFQDMLTQILLEDNLKSYEDINMQSCIEKFKSVAVSYWDNDKNGVRFFNNFSFLFDKGTNISIINSYEKQNVYADVYFCWGTRFYLGQLINVYNSKLYKKKICIVEDGFLRSIITNACAKELTKYHRGISFTFDCKSAYYDARQASTLELLLNDSSLIISDDQKQRARACIDRIVETHLSKYNHQPIFEPHIGREGVKKVLIVDQSYGDMSIAKGLADNSTFEQMLECAIRENPDADIIVKTHPDTIAGTKGYYTAIKQHDNIYTQTEPINPISLIKYCDKVYVCTTQFGFEALMCGKEVHVFGMPFYAGWGLTHDRQKCERRTNTRTLEEVFYIAYIMYSYYVNPDKKCRCEIEEAMDYLLKLRDEYFSEYDIRKD